MPCKALLSLCAQHVHSVLCASSKTACFVSELELLLGSMSTASRCTPWQHLGTAVQEQYCGGCVAGTAGLG
jgi:hypothetical protein